MRHTVLTVAAHTLGCKVNKCDTDALLASLENAGYTIKEFNKPADIYIVNTCTVTHAGDKKSLQMIRRTRRQNPASYIAVCGCMPRGQAESVGKITEAGADFIFDTRKPEDLLAKLEEKNITASQTNNSNAPATAPKRTRAFIKIQDGCNRFCAYCIVPYVRGKITSRPLPEILTEAKTHLNQGIQEIVLTGIQVAAYGYDTGNNKNTLPALIKHLATLGPKRLRLSSIDPWAVNEEFLETVSTTPTLCPHFHLSLQSGCDKTLANMNRRYTTKDYAKVAKNLMALRPDMALTTDIIVGFPGESDEDFAQSLEFAKEMGFAKIHVFEYSQRAGTPAASMPNQIPSQVKSTRGEEMRATAKDLEKRFLQSQIEKQLPVLFEAKTPNDPETWQGHTENYCQVKATGTNLANKIVRVQITSTTGNNLTGHIM